MQLVWWSPGMWCELLILVMASYRADPLSSGCWHRHGDRTQDILWLTWAIFLGKILFSCVFSVLGDACSLLKAFFLFERNKATFLFSVLGQWVPRIGEVLLLGFLALAEAQQPPRVLSFLDILLVLFCLKYFPALKNTCHFIVPHNLLKLETILARESLE